MDVPSDEEARAKKLRQRAESQLGKLDSAARAEYSGDREALVNELLLQKLELEIQVRDLQRIRSELAESRDEYSKLYEFAPNGYLTFDEGGCITSLNAMAEQMLRGVPDQLLRTNVADYLDDSSREAWEQHLRMLAETGGKQGCELVLLPFGERPMDVHIETVPREHENGIVFHSIWVDVTGRKAAERSLVRLNETLEERVALQTSQIELQAKAIASLAEGVLITTCDLELPGPQIIFVNEAMTRITEYSAEELVGQSPRILQGAETDRATLRHIKAELQAGRSCLVEVVNYNKRGKTYDAELYISPLRDSAGSITHFVSIQRDVTERNEIQRRLREREQRFRALTRATSEVIYRMSADWSEMLYMEGRDFLANTTKPTAPWLSSYLPEHEHDRVMQAIERAVQSRGIFELEHAVFRVDGTIGWVHSRAIPILDEYGRVDEWFGAASDITARKEVEATLREGKERLRSVLDTAYDAIVCFDAEGLVTDVNVAAEKMFGYAASSFVGQQIAMILPQPCRDGQELMAARQAAGEAIAQHYDCLGKRSDGSAFPVEVAMSHNDHLDLCTAVIRDVSERLRLQREVVSAAEEAQRHIGQDLHDSAQQDLVGLAMLAEASLESLSQQLGEEESAALHHTRDTLRKIADGLRRVHLEVQHVARGLIPLALGHEGLIPALHHLATRTKEINGVECSFQVDDPPGIHDDFVATHLYRIAQEAVANAIKHGHPNAVMIRIAARENAIVLQVADDGNGFNVAADSEGVGLKTMRYRAGLISGQLTVSSVPARGTLVSCTLPLAGLDRIIAN